MSIQSLTYACRFSDLIYQLETLASKTTKISHRFCDCVAEEEMGGPDSMFGGESYTQKSRHITYLSSFSAGSIAAGSNVVIDFVFLSSETCCMCTMASAQLLYRKCGTATGSIWQSGAGQLLTISWGEAEGSTEDTSKLVWLMGALGIEKASKAEFLAVLLGHALPLSRRDVADWMTADASQYGTDGEWRGSVTEGSILEKALPLVARMASSAEEDEDDEEEEDDELVTCAPKKKPQ
jgi:hypothetical protein